MLDPQFKANGIPTVESGDSCGCPCLTCPICGHEYVHPTAVRVVGVGATAGTIHIDARGMKEDPHRKPSSRGVEIELTFACEDGHGWTYQLEFHKGNTLLQRFVLPHSFSDTDVIWRD